MRFPFTIDRLACVRVAIILVPSYTAAALIGEMVWTVPTLAAASALAASLKASDTVTRFVDETDGGGDHADDDHADDDHDDGDHADSHDSGDG